MPHWVESARQEWEEGYRRLQAEAGDRARYERLSDQVEALRDELRRRVGQTFTLADLAGAYQESDRWARETLAGGPPGWARTLSLVQAAAFYFYARGATDYAP